MNHPICDSCFAICRFALSILHRRVKIIPPRGRFVKSFLAVFREKFLFASSSAEALLLRPLLFGGISRLFALRFFNGLAAQGANALYNDNRGRAGVDDDVRACEVFRAALV